MASDPREQAEQALAGLRAALPVMWPEWPAEDAVAALEALLAAHAAAEQRAQQAEALLIMFADYSPIVSRYGGESCGCLFCDRYISEVGYDPQYWHDADCVWWCAVQRVGHSDYPDARAALEADSGSCSLSHPYHSAPDAS